MAAGDGIAGVNLSAALASAVVTSSAPVAEQET
jgi:hypothetical protein